ncbi:M28 family peptidase [Hymenobacter profundi]|uniref:M28 family peptidase n=1 Tax=Hymenobacter profundi TaxID=1982110 RepID=A0ABS6X583_9BACT|nr:M28 family peptidase [Hymenobacter profundi]MBW3131001.1 M28 family peptidase [Hymenobacter profundi]
MLFRSLLTAFGGLLLAAPAASAQSFTVDKPVARALRSVQPTDVKKHIWYLADDKLRGRQPGTPGYQMAVDYVVGQLKALGMQPAGDNGTYTQTVRLRRATTLPGATLSINGRPLTYGPDFTLNPNPGAPSSSVTAPLAFAGYGISAPELGYDDYAGLDVKGKVVVVVRGAPRSFPSTVASASQDLLVVMQTALQHGAVGVLVGSTNPKAPATPSTVKRQTYNVLDAQGQVANSRTFLKGMQVVGNLSTPAFQALLVASQLDTTQILPALQSGKPASKALAGTLQTTYQSGYHDFESYNVVAKLTGADAQLRDQYVVHSAHLDHLGVGAPVRGDSIYNGAHDNASGVASVLEIAKIYSKLKGKNQPKRSVLFVLQTGEELGLLGSAYFASHPTVPKENIVADINTDMPTIIAPLLSVVALGAQHSSLMGLVERATAYLGIGLEQDPEPEQNRFIRSDQYSFVMQGIPALHMKYGNKTADGKNNLSEQVQVWRAATYHKPQDDTSGTFDFEAGRRYAQLNFLIGYQVAQDPQRPTWNQGDFFGTRFGKK